MKHNSIADLSAEDWIIVRLLRAMACGAMARHVMHNQEYIKACNYLRDKHGLAVVEAAIRAVLAEVKP